MMSDKLNDFPEYASRVLLRLEEGSRTYGDKSFDHSSSRLIDEIEQELLDVLGWGYVLWTRMRKLRAALDMTESADVVTARETDGQWIADVASLPGCMAYGETRHAAVNRARALALRIMADRLEHDDSVSE